MCGIVGIVGKADKKLIEEMSKCMSHRGPDDWGVKVFEKDRVSLGHRRLSILDLSSAGHQPMCDDSGEIWITYNGEIYNYIEIRDELQAKGYRFKSNTDTEVIIYAYKEWGYDCLQKLNGMFAFGIWDGRNKTLFLARDRLGIKPLYYAETLSDLTFASEIKAILASGLVEKAVDYEALNTIWFFQVTPQTGFKGIKKFPPAHYAVLKDGALNFSRYWEINIPHHPINDLDKAAEELRELVADAIHKQMIADVPVGAFLSGGLDSSCVVAFMQEYSSVPVHTFTIKFSEQDKRFESMPEDDVYAKQVAEYIGTQHKEFEIKPDVLDLLPKIIYHVEEPLADPAAINTYLISKYAREQGIIVLLNGMGSDEIFGGYRKDRACLLAQLYQTVTPEILRQLLGWIVCRMPVASRSKGFRYLRWLKIFNNRFANLNAADRAVSSYSLVPISDIPDLFDADFLNSTGPSWALQKHYSFFSMDHLSYLQQITLCDTSIYLPDHNLTYSDKATMAAGVESRPPLIDHRVVEFAFQLADTLKIRGNRQKVVLREAIRNRLPKEIIDRPKAPFWSPIRSWIRNDLRELVDDMLTETRIKEYGIYNPQFIQRKIELDRRGREDNAFLIWTLLNHELWFRTFFD